MRDLLPATTISPLVGRRRDRVAVVTGSPSEFTRSDFQRPRTLRPVSTVTVRPETSGTGRGAPVSGSVSART